MKPYFERDGIVIYHGDCREVLPTLESVDLVLTDPPYGIGVHAMTLGNGQNRSRIFLVGLRQVRRVGVHLDTLPAQPGHGAAGVQTSGKRDPQFGALGGQRTINPTHGRRL